MARGTSGITKASGARSARDLLARILEERELAAAVRALEPSALLRVVEKVGLEDAGEIVALATPEQLTQVFDEDLWKSAVAGDDERFEPRRFLLWLEVLLEAGDDFAADKVADLAEDFLIMAFHRLVLVVDMDALFEEMAEQGEDTRRTERALESALSEELDAYRVIARQPDGWDAVVTLLTALNQSHHSLLVRLLERCAAMSSQLIEEGGGLYDVLTDEEMLAGDVAAEREDRRAAQGFVAPSLARSFLTMAARAGDDVATRDPSTKAYFRELDRKTHGPKASARIAAEPQRTKVASLLATLAEVEPPALRLAAGPDEPLKLPLESALEELFARDPSQFTERMEELAYLANVLVAGSVTQGQRYRPTFAMQGALCTVNLGLELANPRGAPVETLRTQGADQLFRLAFATLRRDVAVPAGRVSAHLLATQARAAGAEDAVRRATDAETPWTARAEVESLLTVRDAPEVLALQGLLDPCPALSGPLASASAQRRGFVATRVELAAARAFLHRLAPALVPRA
ncbi:MAG: hypothetical protein HOO96_44675 [Polyangiaceae bacterium]|nr:hypothetical protein [Polyangiaceae bacterium]